MEKTLEKTMDNLHYEDALSKCLAYTSHFTASIAIFHLIDQKIMDMLDEKPCSLSEIAEKYKFNREVLQEFLLYCSNEGVLLSENGVFSLSELGKNIFKCRGWFEMLVGGYGETYFQLGECLTGKRKYASRNTKYVSRGSCNISKYDAIPLAKDLMSLQENEDYLILDLGCGNGLYLSLFCQEIHNIKALGVEPAKDSYLDAINEIKNNDLTHRITLFNMGAIEFFDSYADQSPDYIIFAFVLHEILGQSGYDGLFEMLISIRKRFPNSELVVIEVDNKLSDYETMKTGIEKDYYNPYYLIHTLTEQKLEKTAFWKKLFREVGYHISKELTVDEYLDPSKLEIGFLLKPSNDFSL